MIVTKIEVFVAHESRFSEAELEGIVCAGVCEDLRETIFEVRSGGSHEVTLGSVCYSIEEQEPLEAARPRRPELAKAD